MLYSVRLLSPFASHIYIYLYINIYINQAIPTPETHYCPLFRPSIVLFSAPLPGVTLSSLLYALPIDLSHYVFCALPAGFSPSVHIPQSSFLHLLLVGLGDFASSPSHKVTSI